MKKIALISLLFFGNVALGATTANFTLASGYIWRGLSFSSQGGHAAQNKPVVQASIDAAHSSGVGFNLFVGNSDSTNFDNSSAVETDHEFDPTIYYNYDLSQDLKLWFAATQFLYVKNSSNNTLDLQASVIWKAFRLDLSFIDEFFGFESSATHVRIGLRDSLTEKFGYFASVGSTTVGKEDLVGFKSYLDYKFGLYQTSGNLTTEIYFSDTDRKNLSDVEFKDTAAIASLSIAFN